MHPDTLHMLIAKWLAIGFPLGIWLGILLGPARVSGVDFRQWFWNPLQPSEVSDDSWIGLMRGAVSVMAGALAVTLLLLCARLWLWQAPVCRWDNFSGLLSLLADCAWYWWQWKHITAIVVGLVVTQFVAEMAWRAGLQWLPALPARRRALVPRPASAAPAMLAEPPAPRAAGRRLIICCDGTWNWPQPERETNVVRLVRAIKPVGHRPTGEDVTQIVHYHLGVGTGNILDRAVGGGAGIGLSNSVKTCYGFLVDNYEHGDEILLFGFSRGAYVVRSVAGMVGSVGLLKKSEMANFYDAWNWYAQRSRPAESVLDEFAPKRHKPDQLTLQCIGVWDTVGALGIPGTRLCAQSFTFHQTALGDHVRHAFQALAIDERRGNFQAAPWAPPANVKVPQILEQVWFPGVHSNIGGGYDDHGLSDTTLLWMVAQILEYRLLDLDIPCIDGSLDRAAPYPTGKLMDSRTAIWIALGCPVPRPVGTTYTGEKIHESAFVYGQGAYAGQRRQEWLRDGDTEIFYRTQFEVAHAVSHRGARTARPNFLPEDISWCDWIMQKLGGEA